RGGSKAYDAEYTHQFADGERTIWTHGVLAQARDGKDYWVGVNIDVTGQKKIKEELHRQADALQEASRRKDEFLALLGHELRNPLAMIRNGLHILLRPNAGIADQERMKEMMEKQVDHLTRMVDDLLDVSRITRGRIQLRKERLELSRSVAQAIPYAAMSETSSNCWKLSVIRVFSCAAWLVGRLAMVPSMAA